MSPLIALATVGGIRPARGPTLTGRNGDNQISDAELRAWAPNPAERTAAPQANAMRLPGYSDFQLVAEGGEGIVYRARQDGLGRYVAVKVINVGDPDRLARFRRELEITVRLGRQHPHIVTVIDTGTAPSGLPCIVMEYYDLGSLHDRLRNLGPLPVNEVVAVGIAVADALAFAHTQGFLHRDVKPQNILILPTSYVLADFGIARLADAGNTTSLQMVSYRHAAPQMIDGQSPAAADDLWSLGSTLFTLLDGAPPFATENPDEDTMLSYLDRVRGTAPRPIRRADIPPELNAIITRCLSKRREDRYPNATALRAALSAIDTTTAAWTPSLPVAGTTPSDPGPTTQADFGPSSGALPVTDPHPAADLGPALGSLAVSDFGPTPGSVAASDFGPAPGSVPFADFGPRPTPPAPPAPDLDSERTALGPGSDLAGLTVRLPDDPTSAPDFGPRSGFDFGPSGPPAETGFPASYPPAPAQRPTPLKLPDPAPPPRRRRLRIALLALAAVLVGGAIGLGTTLIDRQPDATTAAPPPSTAATAASGSATPGGDPAFAPTLDRLEDAGASIALTWTDPTAGKAQFVVVDVTGNRPNPIATVVAGVTTHTVTGLDPTAKQYCFQIIAIGLADPTTQRGASARTCTTR
ncbi:serine/threonine-protein kinase [Actinophytocola sp.]|uniref:serine/threonine-protein kinase n=1 Tax=Actinophytocola sp. TaxID=1872138 RepID=UPI002D80133F|nr:serine/threonine-protein kinase [Actinophytocola sp.]HET9137855.1 serine/threonine-protein kinase [Actinophytocola sp.]